MKARTIVLIVLGCIAVFVILLPLLISVFIWGSVAFLTCEHIENYPAPDPPAITSADFSFTLVYELNGEEIALNDTVTCEYTGHKWLDGAGKKERMWSKTYSSGFEELVLYCEEIDGLYECIVLNPGYSAAYLMGDTENHFYYEPGDFEAVKKTYDSKDKAFRTSYGTTEEDIYEQYGLRLISFELHDEPIVNTFIPEEEVAA